LVELLLAFALEKGLVWLAIFFVEAYRRSDIEVVEEPCNMEKYGVAGLLE
jgi:hypothetical protein